MLVRLSIASLLALPVLVLAERPNPSANKASTNVPSVSNALVRKAIEKSLPFLENEGVAWMTERKCLSCHHVPFMIWTHAAARSRGFPIDAPKLDHWQTWAREDSLSHRHLFRLNKWELDRIDGAKVAADMKAKVTSLLDHGFSSETAFTSALDKALPESAPKAAKEAITQSARLPANSPERSGGGADVVATLLLATYADSPAEKSFRAGAYPLLRELQQPDGSWTPGNQLLSMRQWKATAAQQASTIWIALALATEPNQPDAKLSPPLKKVGAFLQSQPAHEENNEWLATKLLFDFHLDKQAASGAIRKQLLSSQNADGGWGWKKSAPSDPYTTGFVLYAFGRTGLRDNAAVASAVKFLLDRQEADGSWLTPARNISATTVPERLKVRDEIYQYWGTAWAVLGLLESAPSP